MKTSPSVITSKNIADETYHNLIQLCHITGYADPIAALTARAKEGKPEVFYVYRDANGNITKGGGSMR